MLKTNGNFEKSVNNAADCIDDEMRILYLHLQDFGASEKLISLLNLRTKEIKKQIRKELRRNWKPQDW